MRFLLNFNSKIIEYKDPFLNKMNYLLTDYDVINIFEIPDNIFKLALTTDFRDVFAEVARKHLGSSDLQKVFPGYQTGAAKFRGIL